MLIINNANNRNLKQFDIVNEFSYLVSYVRHVYQKSGRISHCWRRPKTYISTLVPILRYEVETWIIKSDDRKHIHTFEIWCWRRTLHISWKEPKIFFEMSKNHCKENWWLSWKNSHVPAKQATLSIASYSPCSAHISVCN